MGCEHLRHSAAFSPVIHQTIRSGCFGSFFAGNPSDDPVRVFLVGDFFARRQLLRRSTAFFLLGSPSDDRPNVSGFFPL
jgi:hypothetical protein